MPTLKNNPEALLHLDQAVKREFEDNRRVLSFDEYLSLLQEHPERQVRGSAQYTLDMFESFGQTPPVTRSGLPRFRVFDQGLTAVGSRRVIGHEAVQNLIYRALKGFVRQGINNKLLLLHGPNGSAKSSITHALMAGLESFSHTPDGALYTFNWVFPVDQVTKGSIGIGGGVSKERESQNDRSYAHLEDAEILSKIPCEMKDHPLLLIPQAQRRKFLEELIGVKATETLWQKAPHYLTRGDLCHRCKLISEALLISYNGDFKKLLMHVQAERFFHSRRYRKGMITIEPQLHVDAQYHQLTMNKNISTVPPALHGINLFTLTGDLVDSNRGMLEFSDILKRPVDTYKYLLIACETGSVNIAASTAHLDTLWIGSANEIQLDAFKEFPDFTSFKARIELIRVPYLLAAEEEREIYQSDLAQLSTEKHVAPHTDWSLALWAVLTRLKKPNAVYYPAPISNIIASLTPLQKAKLLDKAEMPAGIGAEEKKVLRSSLPRLLDEYSSVPYYEGRMGASAREMKSILHGAAQNVDFPCVSPLAVFREMEDFVKRVSEYEFLKQEVKDGYHDSVEFIQTVRGEYLTRIDREVRDSIGLYDSQQWEDFLKKYVQQISSILKKEKIKNQMTGRMEDPDYTLVGEFEKIVEAPNDDGAKESFRQNIISQVGAWSLDHPGKPVEYASVFPEYWAKLEHHYFESQKDLLTRMHNALLGSETEENAKLARETVARMCTKLGYCESCAKEAITFLLKTKY